MSFLAIVGIVIALLAPRMGHPSIVAGNGGLAVSHPGVAPVSNQGR